MSRRVGVAVVGLGGAVATTAVAGVELLRLGVVGWEGLPLADVTGVGLVDYGALLFGGWDLSGDDLAKAAEVHGVLDPERLRAVAPVLSELKPWAAAGNRDYCHNIDGDNQLEGRGLAAQVEGLRADLRRFRRDAELDGLVVINLASTERWPDLDAPVLQTAAGFEAGIAADDASITPGMLYAYAAVLEGAPYANFTPSLAVDVPALVELADRHGVPVGGKDGKTGQTMLKTALAPALRGRSLRVEGWYSANILGNRDGLALDDPDSLKSKLGTKASGLDSILGYEVPDHLVRIDYYRPRGDAKEAWDNIDLVGFLGQRMQLKVNFLCRDSILAAPIVLEIARILDLAQQRGESGVQEQLGFFFKAPMTRPGAVVEHALPAQEAALRDWLVGTPAAGTGGSGTGGSGSGGSGIGGSGSGGSRIGGSGSGELRTRGS